MTRGKNREIPVNCIYFDTESRVETDDSQYVEAVLAGDTVEKEHDTYLICACFSRNRRDTWKDYHGRNFKRRFWAAVDSYTREGQKSWLFAHNAKYDTLAAGAVHYLIRLGYKVESFSDDNPFLMKLVKKGENKGKTIMIVSSTNYYKNSLAELGEIFNLPKLEAAFNARLSEAITYCRRDVEILKIAMENFMDFIDREDLGNFGQTIAAQSFNAYRHRFMPHDIYIHADSRAIEIEREAYSGGRTEAWIIGEAPEVAHVCDINSQYPAVMLAEKYPVMLKTIRSRMGIDAAAEYIKMGYLLIARAEINTGMPIFPVKAGRLVFPVGRFTATLTTPEIMEGIKRGIIEGLTEVCIYEGEWIFADFVDYFYHARLDAKAAGDRVHDLMYKLILNSLYGKFGQRAIDWEEAGEAPPELVKVEHIYDLETGKRRMVKIFGGTVFKSVDREGLDAEAVNSFPAIAAHVTAYARMLLWDYIELAGLDNIYYMDTDSIFVNTAGLDRLQAAGMIDSFKLGSLKLEKSGSLIVYGVKDYVFNGTAKIKGISKNAIQVSPTDFVVNQWVSLSTMLADGRTDGYKNILIKKHLNREYQKGNIMDSGRVLPLLMEGGLFLPDDQAINYPILVANYNRDMLAAEADERRAAVKLAAEADERRAAVKLAAHMNKKARRDVISLGGVNDRDYETIPRWAKRKHGFTLGEIAQELNGLGYPIHTADDVYNLLQTI